MIAIANEDQVNQSVMEDTDCSVRLKAVTFSPTFLGLSTL